MAIGVTPTASATRRMLTEAGPSRSKMARAAPRMRWAVSGRLMYTAYTSGSGLRKFRPDPELETASRSGCRWRPTGARRTLSRRVPVSEHPGMSDPRHDPSRSIRAPRGSTLSCRSWLTEAPFRMLQNNLDAEVAEDPASLVVYGGIGRAARDWDCYDAILATLRTLGDDETLLVQSGKPVGVFRTHADAPRVLIANSNLVPRWANWEHFHELDRKGLMMYGQMPAGPS